MSEDTKLCPFCAEDIKSAAIVCKHCGRELPEKKQAISRKRNIWIVAGIILLSSSLVIFSLIFPNLQLGTVIGEQQVTPTNIKQILPFNETSKANVPAVFETMAAEAALKGFIPTMYLTPGAGDWLCAQGCIIHLEGCDIKGNVAAGGGKQYYLTNHRYYEVIEVDINKGERWFCSEKDAIRMGFKKAK